MDLIDRQAALDAFDKQYWNLLDIPICKEIRDAAKRTIKALPAVQPEPKPDENGSEPFGNAEMLGDRTTDDCISRQAAIEVIDAVFPVDPMKSEYAQGIACGAALAKTYVKQLPSVQPQQIVRCKDCKYADDDGVCQNSVGLVIQDDDDFCSKAERKTDEQTD